MMLLAAQFRPQAPIASGLNGPTGLTVDASGNLYTSDFGNNVIRKFAISTGTLSTFAALPAGSGPFGIAFDPAGSAYVSALSSGLIYKFDSSGARQGGTAAVASPRGIAYNPADGNLYVVSAGSTDAIYKGYAGSHRIAVLSVRREPSHHGSPLLGL